MVVMYAKHETTIIVILSVFHILTTADPPEVQNK